MEEVRDDRTRGRTVDTKRQAAQRQLDILRARRAGQQTSPPHSERRPSRAQVIHDTESESVVEEESDEEDPEADEAIRQTLRDDNDEYDDDFVDDDADDPLGAPFGLDDIPLEFTRHAHKKAKEHFKDAVEWMIQNKLNPAFSRDDPVYRVAFYKLEDEVKGYAGSKFVSAAWAGDFARALKARPEYNDVAVPVAPFDYEHCHACNRTNHPAKFMITFGGKPYHPDTLEVLSDDDDDEDDGRPDGDKRSRDARGNPIPPVDKEYYVGRYVVFHTSLSSSIHLLCLSRRSPAIFYHPLAHFPITSFHTHPHPSPNGLPPPQFPLTCPPQIRQSQRLHRALPPPLALPPQRMGPRLAQKRRPYLPRQDH